MNVYFSTSSVGEWWSDWTLWSVAVSQTKTTASDSQVGTLCVEIINDWLQRCIGTLSEFTFFLSISYMFHANILIIHCNNNDFFCTNILDHTPIVKPQTYYIFNTHSVLTIHVKKQVSIKIHTSTHAPKYDGAVMCQWNIVIIEFYNIFIKPKIVTIY